MTVAELRAPVPDDVDVIVAMEAATFGPDAWSTRSVGEELTGPGRHWRVAVEEGRVVGYAVTRTTGDTADLQRVVVAAEARGRGIGGLLLRELIDQATLDGVRRVLLEVSAGNAAALACYDALGFDAIDRRPAYYREGGDALVLQLDLTPDDAEETP